MRIATALLILCVAPPSRAQLPTADDVRKASASAIGTIQPRTALEGTATLHALPQKFRFDFDARGRYKATIAGDLPQVDAYDGKADWTCGPSGVPHPTALLQQETTRLASWIISGFWTNATAPLRFKVTAGTPEQISLAVQLQSGIVPATLLLDAKTHLAKALSYWGSKGTDTWKFEDYRNYDGTTLPTKVTLTGGDVTMQLSIDIASSQHPTSQDFAMSAATRGDSTYDRTKSARVELKRSFGHLFVHPLLDGKDEGWFFLDTGADVMVIDPAVARKHGRPTIGQDCTAGVVGTVETGYCKGIKFELGPITMNAPSYIELDLSDIAKAFGFPVVGICGYDFIARTSLEIDPATKVLTILEPGQIALPAGMKWTAFRFDSNVPCVQCKFEGDRSGAFNLDTGSDSLVDFCSPAVEQLKLLENRTTTAWQTGGAGGSTASKRGTLGWFELGGRRFEKPSVVFQSTKVGVFANPFFTGNIGMGLLDKYRIVLDYQNQRLALGPPSVTK